MATRHRLAMILAPVLVALIFAGCGSDDELPVPAEGLDPAQEKAIFISQVDQICTSSRAQLEASGDDLFTDGKDPTEAEKRTFVEEFGIPVLQQQIDAIRSLRPPPGDAAEVEAILAAAEDAVAEVREDPDLLVDGRSPGLIRAGKLAGRYGSRACRL